MNTRFAICALVATATVFSDRFSSARAAEGDTKIVVTFGVKVTMLEPPQQSGQSVSKISFVLRRNGTVDEAWEAGSGNEKGSSKQKLGPAASNVTYRVVDSSTIVRRTVEPSHIHRTTVRVDGKSCKAEVAREFKPGHSAYDIWTPSRKRYVKYREIKDLWIKCEIE